MPLVSQSQPDSLFCIARSWKFRFAMIISVRAKLFTGSSGKTSVDLSKYFSRIGCWGYGGCCYTTRVAAGKVPLIVTSYIIFASYLCKFLCKFLCETTLLPFRVLFRIPAFQLSQLPQLSLVPRLPRSGTRTLKSCRRGEPGIFCHMKSAKDRREVDATLIVRGHMRLRTEKGMKVVDNLLHICSYRALNNIHTKR